MCAGINRHEAENAKFLRDFMGRWRTTEHENGVSKEGSAKAGSVCVVQAFVVGDCLKVVSFAVTTQIALTRLTRVGKGTTFCRTRKREGRMTVSVTDLRRSNRLPMEVLCKLWWNADVDWMCIRPQWWPAC